jgi:3,4-dihydroxy 2-butanone 4-phosphate synthase/GTP cyclohydrolase II
LLPENRESQRTAFAVSVDAAAEGISTGISAYDRAKTIAILADPQA